MSYFSYADIYELDHYSTDKEVLEFLLEKKEYSMRVVKAILELRINQFGIAQPIVEIDQDNNRIYIELPGVHDEATITSKLISTANLQFYETFEYPEIRVFWEQANTLSLSPQVKASDLGSEDSLASQSNGKTNADELPGLGSITSQYGSHFFVKLVDRGKVDHILKQRKDISSIFPNNLLFMWSAKIEKHTQTKETGYILYAIKTASDGRAKVGGKGLRRADVSYSSENGSIIVNIQITQEGDAKWAQMTTANVNKIIAITMDDVVYSALNVMAAIKGGGGNFRFVYYGGSKRPCWSIEWWNFSSSM
ncbi:MAG: hypothetical protein HRT57_07205 [Crocinitomicaceae bacterium]|nr:hypothetical protein [Crocinitomicaceae bacterium]